MAIRNLRLENDEILKKRSKDVDVIDTRTKELVEDMIETMHKYEGLGLAAPQIGILKRIIVIDLYDEETRFALINPIIIKQKGEQIVDEGCLSFPNQYGKVKRPKEVVVEALDIDGKKVKLQAKDLLAQTLSHEIDHLNGIVFTDKVEIGTLETVTEERKKRTVKKER